LEAVPSQQEVYQRPKASLLHRPKHLKLVNGPVGAFDFAELRDADGFGFRGLGEEVVDGTGFALALQRGFLPFGAVDGECEQPCDPVIMG
jgi:hypothetical protein